MNIPRRIKLLSAAGALSLTSLTGLIAAAPAQALTISPTRTIYTWYLPVSLNASPGCKAFNVTGYSAQFVGDTSVSVQLYENTNKGWTDLEVNRNTPATARVDWRTGTLLTSPTAPVIWSVSPLPYGDFGTGECQAWLTDSAGRRGATFTVTCM
jgi:hypothetical protein